MLKSSTPFRRLAALILLIASLFCSTLVTAQTAVQPKGAGTVASPYLISNWQELYWISQTSTSWSKQFKQTADIDLALAVPSIKTWNTNTGWTPIGNSTTKFSGKYDGGGYNINGLYINRTSTNGQALFGSTSATAEIHNIGVTEAVVSGGVYVGILVGDHYGNISNCHSSGRVSATNNAGGIVGYINTGGRISSSFSRVYVSKRSGTSTSFGGFAGYNYNGSITNCYSTGSLEYPLTGKGFVGGVYSGGSYAMSGNYWDTQTSWQTTTAGTASGKSTAELMQLATFVGWDFTNTWAKLTGFNDGYPFLTFNRLFAGVVYAVTTNNSALVKADVVSMGIVENTEFGFLLNTSDNLSLSSNGYIAKINLGKITATGEVSAKFENLASGIKYYVCTYAINGNDTTYSLDVGLKTKDLALSIPQGDGTASSPYLISNWQELYWISQTTASWDKQFLQTADIDLTQAVPSIKTWDSNTGWMPIGNTNTNSYFTGTYEGNGHIISGLYINRPTISYQGLFGYIGSIGSVSDLGLFDVNIAGLYDVGSLAGSNSGEVRRCFSTGLINGDSYTGGFIGENGGTIEDCFSKVNVYSNVTNFYYLGGFVGENSQSKIVRCYSTGKVSSMNKNMTVSDKGFVGSVRNTLSTFVMENNYWDLEVSEQEYTGGSYATGLLTENMKKESYFSGWDFGSVWSIDPTINRGYPYLINSTDTYPFLKRAELEMTSAVGTINSLVLKGRTLTFGGSSTVSAHGFIVNTQPTMSISHGDYLKMIDLGTQSVNGGFSGQIDDLEADARYYVCAFVSNEFGTTYTPVREVYTFKYEATVPQGSGDSENDPYRIKNINQLYWIADQVNTKGRDFTGKYFLQVNDIDASDTKNWRNGNGWEPIGSVSAVLAGVVSNDNTVLFQATYNGSGYSISGLYVNADIACAGLFGAVGQSGRIKSVSVTNAYINAGSKAGILVGVNCGYVDSCSVSGSSIASTIVGGLVGYNIGKLTKSQSNSTVKSLLDSGLSCGGLVGENYGIIETSISNGNASGYSGSGFVGTNGSTGSISNSYSRTTANGTGQSGGFVSKNINGSIQHCYSLGSVINKNVGFGSGSTMTGCFWDEETSKTTYDYSGAVGKTTAEMKSANTFIDAGWDFKGETTNGTKDIWVIHPNYNSGYPFLTWEAPQLSYLGGSVYYDRDKNSSFSQGDVALGGIKVELLPEGTITGTARDGSYLFYTAPGDYTVRVIPNDPFYKGTDALEIPVSVKFLEDTVSAPIGLYGTDVYDFSLNMATVWTRCASKVPVWAIVQNKSYLPANIALNINLDPRVTLVSSTVPQDSTGADGKKYFRLANMQPFESRVVELTVSVPAASTDSIFYSSSIQHSGKVVATDDIRSVIRCSYDPNEVQVIPGGLTENGYVPMGQELTYLVRFQNTGNDTAFMVDILDTLSSSLDPLSFEMLASSHEMRYFIERNGALRFLFEDINLEDSTSNEPASHGFVLFKVKPRSTVTTGTRAGLTAHIYFDYNPAVVTNTAVSTFTDQYTKVAQSIDLLEGWNLVSFYVQPGDNAIENALSSCIADIEAVKTGDAFYSADQPEWLNSLQTINGGQAYLIKAKRDTELTVNGLLVFQPFEHKLNKGWNMVGCPVKTDVAVDPMLKNKPVTEAKDFEGFWRPTTPAGNMLNFEPGKGYFIYSDQPAVLPW